MELRIQNLDKLLTLQACSMDRFLIDDDGYRYHMSFHHVDYEGHFIMYLQKKIMGDKVLVSLTWEKPPHTYPYPMTWFSLNEIASLNKFCDRLDALCRTNIYNI